jgi:uncharacterized metal-binding protein
MGWHNQVAVVTGSARGLGRATARLLAQRGAAAVCVNYAVHADAAEALVAEIATAGGRAVAVAADVADLAAVEAMVARTEVELGPVSMVNNAGVAWQGTLDTYDREQVARMRQVKRGRRDPCHARSDGEHAGAALRADRQSDLDRSDRHRAVWQCILRGNEGRGGDSHAALCPGNGPARLHRSQVGLRRRC